MILKISLTIRMTTLENSPKSMGFWTNSLTPTFFARSLSGNKSTLGPDDYGMKETNLAMLLARECRSPRPSNNDIRFVVNFHQSFH